MAIRTLQTFWRRAYTSASASTSAPRLIKTSPTAIKKEEISPLNKNACGIQHLSKELHAQLFPTQKLTKPTPQLTKVALQYLQQNELLGKPCSENEPISFKLPQLNGDNINTHFYNIGLKSSNKYEQLCTKLCNLGMKPPKKPESWVFASGWTRYTYNEPPKTVPYPLEDELVYDCEVMYKQSPYAVMATCMSPDAWYSWCSPYLTGDSLVNNHLIPMGTDKRDCLIVGHNVAFDRARVLEEYQLESNGAFYLDTMSLHVAVSGMCSRQRGVWMKYKKNVRQKIQEKEKTLDDFRDMIQNEELRYTMSNLVLDEESADDDNDVNFALRQDPWMKNSSMNKLSDVAELHCGIKMEKQLRDHFATTDVNEIRHLFQDLMHYCADDVLATYHVLHKVYPTFKKVVPHPVSFAALRHINTSFLPTNSKWEEYIHKCEDMYQKSKVKVEEQVHRICQETVSLKDKANDPTPPWENNPWLSQLDWTITPVKMTKAGEPYKNQKLPGYPEWYKKLVVKNELTLTVKSRVSLLLLNLLWENNPIFWTESKGWCFIVDKADMEEFIEKKYVHVNPEELLALGASNTEDGKTNKPKKAKAKAKAKAKGKGKNAKSAKSKTGKEKGEIDEVLVAENVFEEGNEIDATVEENKEPKYAEKDLLVRKNLENLLRDCKTLFKIPHENGPDARVTSLISKPFLRYYEENVLSSKQEVAKEAFQMNVMNSYWVSSRERIMNQFVVYETTLKQQQLQEEESKKLGNKKEKKKNKTANENRELGFIIPHIIPMGTITRRAVEKTWLTASNAKKTRLGSELKSLIQAPPGYCFVGADVDSEELWIASLVGDSVFRLHGGTALGWMTLEGTKNAGTDLHSKTAKILGISRNEAKVFNYGRIYGAGVKFATSLLKKFNPSISDEKADEVAKTLYAETKGKTSVVKVPFNKGEEKVKIWYGGSESVVFNRLESIAEQDDPKTPVLGAGITAALTRTNLNSKSFLPSRINWAIQSSGVDYLHLLLVSMEYLCKVYNVDARLAITVHDEVRYMTKEENKYKLAMLLQIANLWTRGMFCFQLGIENIPQSCAFFSCVDIDHVLRKEVDFDCITPSNPDPIPHGESIDIYQLLEKEEIKEMLANLNDDAELNDLVENLKISRPVEALDKRLDMSTKINWTKLQICKTDKEFKAKKTLFFKAVDHSKLERFSKKLMKEDNQIDEVVCDGLFDTNGEVPDAELLDAGAVLEQNWDTIVGHDEKKSSKKTYKSESATNIQIQSHTEKKKKKTVKSRVTRKKKSTESSEVNIPPLSEGETLEVAASSEVPLQTMTIDEMYVDALASRFLKTHGTAQAPSAPSAPRRQNSAPPTLHGLTMHELMEVCS